MGLCNSCCSDGELVNDGEFVNLSSTQPSLEESLVKTIEVNSPVFQGVNLLQKFTNSDKFEPRFVWVDFTSHTIHLSTFKNNKDRRHKEANLADVVSLRAGLPNKVPKEQFDQDLTGKCMTISFKRGGNVDLMLDTTESRQLWYNTLRKIVERAKASNGV